MREGAAARWLAYTGIVFKQIAPADFTAGDFEYAQAAPQHHLVPLRTAPPAGRDPHATGSKATPYCPATASRRFSSIGRDKLTDAFLEKIKADDGILVNLASSEMKRLFDWKRICREVRVVTPEFRIREDDRLKTVVVYTKMCRGEMTRHILKNRIGGSAAC